MQVFHHCAISVLNLQTAQFCKLIIYNFFYIVSREIEAVISKKNDMQLPEKTVDSNKISINLTNKNKSGRF